MNYIKYFDDKVKQGLEKNDKYQEARKAVEHINGQIDDIKKEFPLVYREGITFEKFLDESRSFNQSYAEREDEYDKYDYKISQNFFDREAVNKLKAAKEDAVKYFDQLGVFLEKHPYYILEAMLKDLNKNTQEMNTQEEKTVRKVIVEQISSPELTSFINDFIKETIPQDLGQYGNKIKKVIGDEYKVMQEDDYKLRRQIQNEIRRVDNENEIF